MFRGPVAHLTLRFVLKSEPFIAVFEVPKALGYSLKVVEAALEGQIKGYACRSDARVLIESEMQRNLAGSFIQVRNQHSVGSGLDKPGLP
jgi:hypothetical protein